MTEKFYFTGSQENEENQLVEIKGYLQLLEKEFESETPVKGLIKIFDTDNLIYNFKGSLKQLILGVKPKLEIFVGENLGQNLFYRFNNLEFRKDKLFYNGIWFPITKEFLTEYFPLPFNCTPKNSKKVSIEIKLNRTKKEFLIKQNLINV